MTESLKIIVAIIRADILFRFRRTTAVVIFLILAAGVYLIVPDVSTGRTLIQIDGRRVLYNSAAVALGTAMFCGLLLVLFGYYLVSNSFRRDINSRMGFVIAATPVTDAQYIIGKILGNIIYLMAIMLSCMLSAMVMFLIRGESGLEPLVFLTTYVWMVVPGIVFCSTIAIAFEALPLLSGRFGDVLYFFLWAALLGFPAAMVENNVRQWWLNAFDITGFIPLISQLQEQFHTTTMSIGVTSFNASREPVLFNGIVWNWSVIGYRFLSLVLPGVLFVGARSWFHRFNPTRIKSSIRHSRKNPIVKLNAMLKPLKRFVGPLVLAGRKGQNNISFFNAVHADVATTLELSPLTILAIIVFAVLSLFLDISSVREGLLPVIIVVLILALADIVTRDSSSGMMSLLFTAPKIKPNYVLWKFASAVVVTFCFTLIPVLRLLFESPSVALSLFVGSCFIAGGATGFGVLARTPKLFVAIFLMLLYIALNAPAVPAFDFAGFHARATLLVQCSYALLTIMLVLVTLLRQRFALKNL